MAMAGEAADRKSFGDFIKKSVNLYKYDNGYSMSVKETANWSRT